MAEFHKILIVWYQQNKRDLPWRAVKNPYFVWVSEIILQQTRVDQGTSYFLRFIERFPDVVSLANAHEDEVLKIWQGLGYYSRARNMHVAALQIKNEFQGLFPCTYTGIRSLKGVGDYTAAAIASISFGFPYPAIDGNVYRVLSRIFGITAPIDISVGKNEFIKLAYLLLDTKDPGIFNEAMMEFGALRCAPKKPLCHECPFQYQCIAFARNEVAKFPVRSKKAKVRDRYFNYLYIRHCEGFYFEKRTQKDIWHNLYQLPLIETQREVTLDEFLSNGQFISLFDKKEIVIGPMGPEIIHQLTHQKLHVRFLEINVLDDETNFDLIRVHTHETSNYPVPKLIDNFLSGR